MEMNGEMSEGLLRQCLVVDVELWNLAAVRGLVRIWTVVLRSFSRLE